MLTYTIQEINEKLKGVIVGNTTQAITGPEQLELANNQQITFIGNKKYIKLWESSKACAAIINGDIDLEPGPDRAFIKVKNADVAMAEILELFVPEAPVFDEDIHPTAIVHATATVGRGCKIGAGSYVGKGVQLGNDVILYPNTTVLDNTTIGNNTTIWSGAVIRERCIIGNHCIIHPNATIGADGFGFRPSPDGRGLIKIPHIGNVIIGNGVEIGANSCVDRGKFSATIVGDGCKIDNLVQIGHNSKMGRSCIMAGASGLAGSVTLGDGVVVGGGVCISDHVTLGNGVQVGGMSGVINNFGDGKKVLGYPAVEARDALKQWVALKKLAKEG
jgi:UDP-3-O-[3-hydroxymyristoyl] glucosamine N-acyltransferase